MGFVKLRTSLCDFPESQESLHTRCHPLLQAEIHTPYWKMIRNLIFRQPRLCHQPIYSHLSWTYDEVWTMRERQGWVGNAVDTMNRRRLDHLDTTRRWIVYAKNPLDHGVYTPEPDKSEKLPHFPLSSLSGVQYTMCPRSIDFFLRKVRSRIQIVHGLKYLTRLV